MACLLDTLLHVAGLLEPFDAYVAELVVAGTDTICFLRLVEKKRRHGISDYSHAIAQSALVDLFLNDVELAAGLDVVFYGHGRRRRDNVRYLLAAFWIKHVDVEDAGSRVVPCCSWKGILGDILDFTEC